ncbi:MAG TPA: hypothetical protein VGG79_09680 [Roseiarcus sp.]
MARDRFVAVAASWAHFAFACMLAFVLAAHLGGAVWYAAIKRDSALARMWRSYRPAGLQQRTITIVRAVRSR